jgi:hypothetical protein
MLKEISVMTLDGKMFYITSAGTIRQPSEVFYMDDKNVEIM